MEVFDIKRTLDITNKCLQSLGTSLNRGFTVLDLDEIRTSKS